MCYCLRWYRCAYLSYALVFNKCSLDANVLHTQLARAPDKYVVGDYKYNFWLHSHKMCPQFQKYL